MQLGFIGVGNIGMPMCHHLLQAGHAVLVYDVNASHLARMVNLGAQPAASPKAVAPACESREPDSPQPPLDHALRHLTHVSGLGGYFNAGFAL